MASESPSAVRLYAPDHPALAHTVAARLNKEIGQRSNQIAAGYASDWADYKTRTGFIEGLRHAIKVCEEVEKELR